MLTLHNELCPLLLSLVIHTHTMLCKEIEFIASYYKYLYITGKFNHWGPSDDIWWYRSGLNIGSGNGLFPDGTKPFTEPMLSNRQWGIFGIHPKAMP